MRCVLLLVSAAFLLGDRQIVSCQASLETSDLTDTARISAMGPLGFQSAKIFDRFGAVSSNDEKARLDNFTVELQSDPTLTGYIIVFGRPGRPLEAKKRADRAKNYLIYNRRIGKERLVSLDHCFRAKLEIELWIVPRRAKAPVPCPVRATKR